MKIKIKPKVYRILILILNFIFIILIGLIDYKTGFEMSFSIFYLIPIIWVAFNFSRNEAVGISIFSAIVWGIADSGHIYSQSWVVYWNTIVRLTIFILVSYSLSQIKTSIETERSQKKKLEELNNQKNTFLGIAAHDLRNPISVIKMYTSYILNKENKNLTNSQAKLLETVNSSSNFMLSLVDDLLDYSKIESGAIKLDLAEYSYTEFVMENVEINRVFADKKGIKISVSSDRGIPKLTFDRNKMFQVLNNLLINSIHYSHNDSAIRILVSKTDGSIITRIADDGVGIPKKELSKVFKAFYKGISRPTAGEKSTGLGLAIAKKIVETHKGKIWLESKPGKGTTFFYSLPIK